jgi:hypothetical protein
MDGTAAAGGIPLDQFARNLLAIATPSPGMNSAYW